MYSQHNISVNMHFKYCLAGHTTFELPQCFKVDNSLVCALLVSSQSDRYSTIFIVVLFALSFHGEPGYNGTFSVKPVGILYLFYMQIPKLDYNISCKDI